MGAAWEWHGMCELALNLQRLAMNCPQLMRAKPTFNIPIMFGYNPPGNIPGTHLCFSDRTMATQPLTEMSTSNISWGSSNLGASTSWGPQGLSRDCFTFTFTLFLLQADSTLGTTCGRKDYVNEKRQ
jgi:hypothetical protein